MLNSMEIKFRAYWTNPTNNPYAPAKMYTHEELLNYPSSSGCPDLLVSLIKHQLLNQQRQYWFLMLYTGLKDKNGKEIYQGDILRVFNKKLGWTEGEVYFGFGKFKVCAMDLYELVGPKTYPEDMEAEVIGNIYENKELLNKQ